MDREAGGITQHIGATEVPAQVLNETCAKLMGGRHSNPLDSSLSIHLVTTHSHHYETVAAPLQTLPFSSLTSWRAYNHRPLNPSTSSSKPRRHSSSLETKSIVFMDGFVSVIARLLSPCKSNERTLSTSSKTDTGSLLDKFPNMGSTWNDMIKSKISGNPSHLSQCLQRR